MRCDHIWRGRVPRSPELSWTYYECLHCGEWKREKQTHVSGEKIRSTSADGYSWGEAVRVQ